MELGPIPSLAHQQQAGPAGGHGAGVAGVGVRAGAGALHPLAAPGEFGGVDGSGLDAGGRREFLVVGLLQEAIE